MGSNFSSLSLNIIARLINNALRLELRGQASMEPTDSVILMHFWNMHNLLSEQIGIVL